MMELFDTTGLRQQAALGRVLAEAGTVGQRDLFTAAVMVTAYVALSAGTIGNVYVLGWNCTTCDRSVDPAYRVGVPCVNAHWHARHTVDNWRRNGSSDARVVAVEIVDTGDRVEMVAAARRAAAATVPHVDLNGDKGGVWPGPVGALWARDDVTGAAMLA